MLEVVIGLDTQLVLNLLGEAHKAILIAPLKKTFHTKDDNSNNGEGNCEWPRVSGASSGDNP
mgnify:CR=1 FL=1